MSGMIRVERPAPAWCAFVVRDEDTGEIVGVDGMDVCGVASTFGWRPCACGETDGTVACAHRTVSNMYDEAYAYLDECANDGRRVMDPGYFTEV